MAITIELCVMITVSWTQQNGQIYKIVIFCSAIPRDVYLLSAYGTSKVDPILAWILDNNSITESCQISGHRINSLGQNASHEEYNDAEKIYGSAKHVSVR